MKVVLLYIGVEEGASVPIDAILAVVGEEGEDYQSLLEGQKGKKEEQDSAEEKGRIYSLRSRRRRAT